MTSQSSSNTTSAPAQKAYQSDIIDGALQEYVAKSKEIGGPVAQHVSVFNLRASFEAINQLTADSRTHHRPA
jgi:hypothetical protein